MRWTRNLKLVLGTCCAIGVVSMLGVNAALSAQKGAVPGDFGDAPDLSDADFGLAGNVASPVSGQYPSLLNTTNTVDGRTGPYHDPIEEEWLGDANDFVDAEDDSNQVDVDPFDDGFRGFFFLAIGVPIPTWAIYEVTVAPDAPNVARFLNVAMDFNLNGKWANQTVPEHVVIDAPVSTAPGTTDILAFGPFGYGNSLAFAFPTWIRGTLTRAAIDLTGLSNGWDGSGPDAGLGHGETEDFWFSLNGNPSEGEGEGEGEG
ncbi:MAG: hypothetical protein AAB353_06855, partial [Candidatus Hydrogenedentota bacterium]